MFRFAYENWVVKLFETYDGGDIQNPAQSYNELLIEATQAYIADMYKLKEEPVENVAELKVEETKKEIKEEDHKEDYKKDVLNPVYLCDTKVYSNLIYEHVKDVDLNQKCLGKLDTYITGHILGFLDYKTIMSNIRYLNKSFIKFTTDMLHYIPDLKKDAFIRVKAPKMYKGVDKMPPLRHPYYKN